MKTITFRIFPAVAALAICFMPALSRAQSFPPAWSASATYSAGDLVQEGGNTYRAIKAVPITNLDPAKYYTYWELNYVRSNTTLLIGQGEPFATFSAAWNSILNCRVADGVYLHLYISSFHGPLTQTYNSSFSLDQDSGSRISIIGDNPNGITFNFPSAGGLTIDSCHALAGISNIDVTGQSAQNGITASNGASIQGLENVTVNGFGVALEAESNASITGISNCTWENIGIIGGYAITGGNLTFAQGFVFDGTGAIVNTQYGFVADYGGSINAFQPTIHNTGTALKAAHGGNIIAQGATLTNNGTGALAFLHGTIGMADCNATTDTIYDAQVSAGGIIDITNGAVTKTSVGTADASYLLGP